MKTKQDIKRKATKQRILNAFESVLLREGTHGLGVNAVLKEAGVGKSLLYLYFGGLEGLASSWLNQPSVNTRAQVAPHKTTPAPRAEQIQHFFIDYANMLKKNGAFCQILGDELNKTGDHELGLQQFRTQLGKVLQGFYSDSELSDDEDLTALLFILEAATNYLALKASFSPNFNGINIANDEGWGQVMDMISLLCHQTAEKT
jgi:AcrR family transcriptional regulator